MGDLPKPTAGRQVPVEEVEKGGGSVPRKGSRDPNDRSEEPLIGS